MFVLVCFHFSVPEDVGLYDVYVFMALVKSIVVSPVEFITDRCLLPITKEHSGEFDNKDSPV